MFCLRPKNKASKSSINNYNSRQFTLGRRKNIYYQKLRATFQIRNKYVFNHENINFMKLATVSDFNKKFKLFIVP